MCGICGVIGINQSVPEARNAVERMCKNLTHRGPDGKGTFYAERIALGFRRLSIIDLDGGWQPLYNEDKSIVLLTNGEIYNYVEVRCDLEAKGHIFSTKSDCEVIVHLYEEYGVDFLKHLRGMFAIALWDDKQNVCVLARDRMGEKPLYYYQDKNAFVFASEIKSILCSHLIPFELNPTAINFFLHYNYIPTPYSPIKNLHKLPPAHYMVVDTCDGTITMTRYWDMADQEPSTDEPSRRLRGALRDIMGIVTRSDVPVGLALSGGIDSSAIASLLAEQGVRDMNAISVGYAGCPACDERDEARRLSALYGFKFHEVEIGLLELSDFFPQLVYWMDTPVADVSGYGYYALMHKSRELDIPVLLKGHGGDEFFWGYPWVKEGVPLSIEKQRRLLSPKGGAKYGDVAPLVFIEGSPQFAAAQEALPIFFSRNFRHAIQQGPSLFSLAEAPLPWPDPDIHLTKLICEIYLEGNGITQCDRYGMASSVEVRLPFVDHNYVETIIALRKAASDNALPAKSRLKDALRGIVPDEVLNRPKKGFAPPLLEWMTCLRKEYGTLLLDGYLVRTNILDKDNVQHLFEDRHIQWRGAPVFFKILVLELWCRNMSALVESDEFHPIQLKRSK